MHFSPILHPLIPPIFPNQEYHLILTEGAADKKEGKFSCKYQALSRVWSKMELFSNRTDMLNYVRFYYQKHPQNSIYVSVVTSFLIKVFVFSVFFPDLAAAIH